ncbi:ABC transporter permease subunit [Lentibacillus sp. N15]
MLKFVLTTIGIILIAAVPALFQGMKLDVSTYVAGVESIVSSIFHPGTITYELHQEMYPLFPGIWARWEYSIMLLFLAFFVAFLLALALTYVTMLLPRKGREKIKFLLYLTESVPDVLVIGFFIVIVIPLYKHTGILLFNIAAYGDERILILPTIALAALPTLLFYRNLIYDFEEEISELYIDVAKSKGLRFYEVLFFHVLRNAIIRIFLQAKSIIGFMLSSLLIVEYIFETDGMLRFMFDHYSPEILTVGLLLLFVPIYAVQSLMQIMIEKTTGRQVEV